MNARQRAYRFLWRARDIAADDIREFVTAGRISGAMGAIWEGFTPAERDEVWKAGPARAEEVGAAPDSIEPEPQPELNEEKEEQP